MPVRMAYRWEIFQRLELHQDSIALKQHKRDPFYIIDFSFTCKDTEFNAALMGQRFWHVKMDISILEFKKKASDLIQMNQFRWQRQLRLR